MANIHKEQINCSQINPRHSRGATDNLMQIISQENTEMVMIQDPYLYQNSTKAITSGYRTYTHGNGKSRAAIVITNNTIVALLLMQYSDKETVLLEIRKGNKKLYAGSIYMDYKEEIDNSQTIESILKFKKGGKLIMEVDSNLRSTMWNDKITNPRRKKIEEFVVSLHLHVINEKDERTTFQSTREKSNIDLTITNNQMLTDVINWDISEEESVSDHNIIKFSINLDKNTTHGKHLSEPRYRIKEHQLTKFSEKLKSNITKTFQMEDKERNTSEIDEELSSQAKDYTDIGQFTIKLEEVIQITCSEICKPPNTEVKGKTIPWWTESLKIMRKRTNALRRRYRRTTNNEELRENRKNRPRKSTKRL